MYIFYFVPIIYNIVCCAISLTAGHIGGHLDPDARIQWNTRGRVDKLIIMDWNTEVKPYPDPINIIMDAIMNVSNNYLHCIYFNFC